MDSGNNQGSTLQEHSERLRACTDAICCFSGGIPNLKEGIEVLRDYCEKFDFWIDSPVDLRSQPAAYGDEHEVWFHGGSVIKLTYPDFFGLRVVYRSDEDNRCNPCEYFERWHLHNELFGDDVEIIGAINTLEGIRLALYQKAIEGHPTTEINIKKFFVGNGWRPFETNEGNAWFDEAKELVISDTHEGNLIETADGILVPIDFRIQQVSGSILDAVKSLVANNIKATQ